MRLVFNDPSAYRCGLCMSSAFQIKSSIILTFLLVKLTFLFCCGILVLLILRDQVVHVALCFSELHFVHTFSCVPVQEGLAAEHRCEVLCHALEHLLDGCCVTHKSNCHLQPF